MAKVRETRTVQKAVFVTQCDGPGCNVEVVSEREYDEVPSGWFTVIQKYQGYRSTPLKGVLAETLMFHRWACLVAWMGHHRFSPDAASTEWGTPSGDGHPATMPEMPYSEVAE